MKSATGSRHDPYILASKYGATAIAILLSFPTIASGGYGCSYGDAYGEGYYEGYYEAYYEAYYQGTYQTTVNAQTFVVGDLSVYGSISKGSGTFVIDHPLDPKNKLLYHSFVESSDVKDLYDGIVTLDKNGEAIIRLPDYFDALNGEVRYQLKPIGAPMPNLHVKVEQNGNQFTIGGGEAKGKVSWQVTGIRHDAYILANPIIPEVEKGPDQLVPRGEYLYPEVIKGMQSGVFAPFWKLFSGLFGGK